ncbi:holin [Paenibacillus sp. LMG 31461]|uniref:Holin n=1 Tax=Paenibacillus plantarum TaxID=2654975 RepID=A0ABX1X4F2_9BACL|nr:phage holin family protein [Paenibacillus plantarum]NOU63189.1 holin [Paenibacillus plantarum]
MDFKPVSTIFISAAAGANGKEITFGGIFAAVATFVVAALGGWDVSLRLLAYMMIADYATGFLGAWKNKKLNSDVMLWGGVRKGIVMLVIILAVQLDQLLGGQAPIFRTLAIYYYAGREGLSLIENFGVLGVPWPPAIQNALEQLKQKGESTK